MSIELKNFEIDTNDLKKYLNIVKLILDKININNKELFIYNFIVTKEIKYNTKKFVELYNDYILDYETKLNLVENNIDSETIDCI